MKLDRFEPLALNLLRIVAGFLFLQYGGSKLWGWFDGSVVEFPELRFFAGVIEFFGGIAIMVGLKTRWVALLASGQMAFAYFLSHAPRGFWPYENGGTTATLFCFIFLYLFVRGGGGFSVDGLLKRRAGRQDV